MKNSKCFMKQSYVDDGLFGQPNRIIQRKKLLEKKWQSNNNSTDCAEIITTVNRMNGRSNSAVLKGVSSGLKDKDVTCEYPSENVRVISQDLQRSLRVPKEQIKTKSLLLNPQEFFRLKSKANVLTTEEEHQIENEEKKVKEEIMTKSRERRIFMQNMDLKRRRNEKLTDLEEEAYRKAQYLLQNATIQREEQEPEIKLMNNLAKNIQVQAIRDKQVLEKQQLTKEMTDEERRLDQMMEVERLNQIKIQEAIDQKRKEEEKLGAFHILKQMEENEESRLIELEMKDQENKAYQRKFQEDMEAEHERRILEETKKHQIRRELDAANTELLKRKYCDKERDIILTQRVLEFQKEKGEREEAFERQQQLIKREKAMDIAKVRALQERFQDQKAEIDALNAKRALEAGEREWRRKEAEEVRKKQETMEILQKSRTEQLREQVKVAAVQAAKDREDFNRMLKAQKEALRKDNDERNKRAEKSKQYTEDIKKQILEKERQLILERNEFFMDGCRMEEQARLRNVRLNDAKERKFNELRKAGIPDCYLNKLNRKLKELEVNRRLIE